MYVLIEQVPLKAMVTTYRIAGYFFETENFAEDTKPDFRRFSILKSEYFEVCMLDFK